MSKKPPSGMPSRFTTQRPATREPMSTVYKVANDAAAAHKANEPTARVRGNAIPSGVSQLPAKFVDEPLVRTSNWLTPAQRRAKRLGALVSPKR